MSSTTHLLTYEEALALPEDPLEEVVRGEIRKMPPPDSGHMLLLETLSDALCEQLGRAQFQVVTSAYGLGIARQPFLTARIPDLSVFDKAALQAFRRDHPRGYIWTPPLLAVECLSPSNRKGSIHHLLGDYESIRVPEVWLIHPERRVVEQYLLAGEALEHSTSVSGGVVRPVHCAADIQVDDLWKAFYGE